MTDGLTIARRDDLESAGSWALVRRSLGVTAFGVNIVDIAPGASIPEHDETSRDQEELFLALSGSATLVVNGADHPFPEGTFARLDPAPLRTIRNDGDETASVLIISAPRTSGYEPMEWA